MPALLALNNYHYRRGGAEVVFLEHMRLMEECGWETAPFCMQHELNLPTPWSRFFVDEIEFGRSYSAASRLAMASRVVYSMQARRRVRAALRHRRFDVAHAHNVYHHISPAVFGAIRAEGVPLVLTLHDLKLACPNYKMMTHDGLCERCRGGAIRNVVKHRCVKNSLALSTLIYVETAMNRLLRSYEHVSRFVVPSYFLLEKMVDWGWPRDRFVWIPNFVDVDSFAESAETSDSFLYVGRLSYEKGIRTLIDAVAAAGVSLDVVGAGPEEAALKAQVERTGARVTFHGYRSGQDLRDLVARARAVVLPSEVYENAPLSVLEAYAAARPVIGARIGGIPELIREGRTGATFASGDSADLAQRLREFAGYAAARLREMGAEGREWVRENFTASRHREMLLQEYRKLGVPC